MSALPISEVKSGPYDEREMDVIKESNSPKFDLEPVHLQFGLPQNIEMLQVKNNQMYILLENSVYHIDLSSPTEVRKFDFKKDQKILNSWQDPNGSHLLIQMQGGYYCYINGRYNNMQFLTKLKNMHIQHVCFTSSSSDDDTGSILICTDHHLYIYALKLHNTSKETKFAEKSIKMVYRSTSKLLSVILTASDSRIALLTESNILEWDCFDTSVVELWKVFKTTDANLKFPNMSGMKKSIESDRDVYVILVEPFQLKTNDPELILSGMHKLPLQNENVIGKSMMITKHHLIFVHENRSKLLIFNKLSKSSPKIIDTNVLFGSHDRIEGIVADYTSKTYWIYSKSQIYEIIITNESVSVWYNYFNLGKYDEALSCLENTTSDFFKRDMILIKQGYDLLQRGDFGIQNDIFGEGSQQFVSQVRGIKILAESTEPFEKVCLMLLNMKNIDHTPENTILSYSSDRLMLEYMLVKLRHAHYQEKNKLKVRILSSWVVELNLRIITELEEKIRVLSENDAAKEDLYNEDNIRSVLLEMDDQFKKIISEYFKVLDSKTMYDIMRKMNQPSKMIYYVEYIEDYGYLLEYYISVKQWEMALRTLRKIYSLELEDSKFTDLLYKKALTLIMNEPEKTVNLWLNLARVDYEKLLPSILAYNKNNKLIALSSNHSIKFLSKLIYDKMVVSKVINNHYLSLLIIYPLQNKEEEQLAESLIKKFFSYFKESTKREYKFGALYDSNFLLRLCINYKKHNAVVTMLINDFRLYEQALTYSLENGLPNIAEFVLRNYDLSNSTAAENYGSMYSNTDRLSTQTMSHHLNMEEESYNLKKRLWLLYAKYIIDQSLQGKSHQVYQSQNVNHNDSKNSHEQNGVEASEEDVVNANIPNQRQVSCMSAVNDAIKYLLYLANAHGFVPGFGIKDLLPLLPENIMINNFKEEIVKSLNNFNSTITHLSQEMEESLGTTRNLKSQIAELYSSDKKGTIYTVLEPGEPCRICDHLLVNKNFICFPNCHHNFHKDCLVKYLLKSKGDYRFKRIFETFKRNSSAMNKQELDKILLKECILCNESNISFFDAGVTVLHDELSAADDWDI
ncbi:Piso0_005456 [Millerozyma farinosa CBS 7064]|uniref:Piso0_005456 protein n=1 Tax=Pichia sorbitophila (strain ATCC MYA-4447 / BCRC 22081 / CBS 7064 / NBRC 10061 / NRRL Y-12695) TaxID=559304 RepID=G8Y553_PICSO|nr:Piso0_005456 [Millerozyma farinosa CBS 7064]